MTNFVSSITFDEEENLDIKVERKHGPGITSVCHKDTIHTKVSCKTSLENFDQQRQYVATSPPSNNLSRVEKLTRLCVNFYLSSSKANKVECEYCQEVKLHCKYLIRTNKGFRCSICSTVIGKDRMASYNHIVMCKHKLDNLSRIEVTEKLASMKIDFDLNKSLSELQNLLRENLIKQKCKEHITDPKSTRSSLALEIKPDQTRLINIESKSVMSSKMVSKSTSVPSVNSSVSKKYTKDQYYLEMVEKRDRDTLGRPHESKRKVQGIVMKKDSNSLETIDLDKMDSIPKRGRTGEDITCKLCLQPFCYKFQFYKHLKEDHAIDALQYEKID